MRRFGAALAISVLLVTSGCGGSDKSGDGSSSKSSADQGTRPTSDQIVASLMSVDPKVMSLKKLPYDTAQARCVAGILLGSKLSNKGLRAVASDITHYNPTGADGVVAGKIGPKISACLAPAAN
jgi:hypothetical protein